MITTKELLNKVGSFDPIFFMYGEEADLCWRMNHAGYRLVYMPDSIIYHYGSGTIGKIPYKKVFFHHRNGPILLLKNYKTAQLMTRLPVRILFDMATFWYYLLINKIPNNALSVLKAYVFILYELPTILKKRKEVMKKISGRSTIEYPLYSRSIVLDYFINNMKKFSQLPFQIKTHR